MHTYEWIIFFFIIQRVKARAIPWPHHPPTSGDNTVSVVQVGTATPGATKQLLPPGRVLRKLYIYIYIYTPDQLRAETLIFIFSVQFTFGCWCYYACTVTVSYVITREWWFRVYFIHAENFSLSTKSNLLHIAPWSEDDLRQLSNCCQWFLFLKETKWLSILVIHRRTVLYYYSSVRLDTQDPSSWDRNPPYITQDLISYCSAPGDLRREL